MRISWSCCFLFLSLYLVRSNITDKYQQIVVDHPEQNGSQSNPLANLLGQYNSDSEADEDNKPPENIASNKLNDQVNDFLKVNWNGIMTRLLTCIDPLMFGLYDKCLFLGDTIDCT